ncbi:hypothetical protein JXB27_01525 [Candidatus Woesearchaeota archaeon]|nr:hypothetical protein [Candidatus Woesearchaeota archaeon]
MKASFSNYGDELEILLEQEEVEMLRKKTLLCSSKRLEREVMVFLRKVKKIDSNNLSLDTYLLPPGANFETVQAYLIEVNSFGYDQLLRKGGTGDRTGSLTKVKLYNKSRLDELNDF